MAPTTLTTIVMIAFAVGVLSLSAYTWFGSWQPVVRRATAEEELESEYREAVREMRQALERYERGEQPLWRRPD